MRKYPLRRLAGVLAAFLTINCVTPAFAGITSEDGSPSIDHILDEDEDWSPHSSSNTKATDSNWKASGTKVITDITELDGIFEDEALKKAVWNAIKDESCEGTSVEEALGTFTGTLKANGKKIKSIQGIHLLKSAELIDLSNNEITDWTPLKAPASPGSTGFLEYYGGINEYGEIYDTEVKLGKNPIEKIPCIPNSDGSKGGTGFGGRLVIAQPGTQSWTYELDPAGSNTFTFVREDQETFEATLDIGRCVRVDDSGGETPAHIISAAPNFGKEFSSALLNVESFDDTSAMLSNIVRSGLQRIGIGVDQDLHYETADGYGTITPGSQSFKYYIQARIKLYDKIKVTSGPYTGGFVLTKVDSGNSAKKLPGAVYELQRNGVFVKNCTTDSQGKISLVGLTPGAYTLTETIAPKGYQLNAANDPVEFVIEEHETTINGGLTSVIDRQHVTHTVADDRKERYIAGPSSYPDNGGDIELTRASQVGKAEVTVTYHSLGGTPNAPGLRLKQIFPSVKAAQDHINQQKNSNKITGLVEVDVKYVDTLADAESVTVSNDPVPNLPPEETIMIGGHKEWVDEANYQGLHPAIGILLYQNGTEIDSITLYDGQEDYEFHNLKAKDSRGIPYRYTVSEEFLDPSEKPKFLSRQDGYNFTNTYIGGTRSIQGHKGWDHTEYYEEWHRENPKSTANAPDPVNPDITIELEQDGKLFQTYVMKSGKDSYVFQDLPQRNPRTGKEYTYTVKEANPKHYKPSKSVTYDFLNTYEPDFPETPPSDPPPPPPSNGGGGGGGGGGNPSPPEYSPKVPGGPGDVPPTSQVPPAPGETPPETVPWEQPTFPVEALDGSHTPASAMNLPKTGETNPFALWILVGSLGLALGIHLKAQNETTQNPFYPPWGAACSPVHHKSRGYPFRHNMTFGISTVFF